MKFAKKSLGQNFLIDLNIIKKIINLKEINNKNIIEIGPGRGALTDQILKKKPKSIILIEKDNLLSHKLKEKYSKSNVRIYNEDILKFDLEKKIKKDTIIFGNLPYNISSQILVKIIRFEKWPPKFTNLIFMFQKEMAERIIGNFGTKKYGRLSILSNYRLRHLKSFNVSANCFFPKPKIESTVLNLIPFDQKNNKVKDIRNLEKITNIFFSNKRKMVNKSLKRIFLKSSNTSLINNLDLKSRPADLKPEDYYKITKLYERN